MVDTDEIRSVYEAVSGARGVVHAIDGPTVDASKGISLLYSACRLALFCAVRFANQCIRDCTHALVSLCGLGYTISDPRYRVRPQILIP